MEIEKTNVKDIFLTAIGVPNNKSLSYTNGQIIFAFDVLRSGEGIHTKTLYFHAPVPSLVGTIDIHWCLYSMSEPIKGDIQITIDPRYENEEVTNDEKAGQEEIKDYIEDQY